MCIGSVHNLRQGVEILTDRHGELNMNIFRDFEYLTWSTLGDLEN